MNLARLSPATQWRMWSGGLVTGCLVSGEW